jgi:hypothetical protein
VARCSTARRRSLTAVSSGFGGRLPSCKRHLNSAAHRHSLPFRSAALHFKSAAVYSDLRICFSHFGRNFLYLPANCAMRLLEDSKKAVQHKEYATPCSIILTTSSNVSFCNIFRLKWRVCRPQIQQNCKTNASKVAHNCKHARLSSTGE